MTKTNFIQTIARLRKKPLYIKIFDGYYACNDGHIYSTAKGLMIRLAEKENNNGSLTVCCFDEHGERRQNSVQGYIAKAFLPNPSNHRFVLHKDGNNRNNAPDNLMWAKSSRG